MILMALLPAAMDASVALLLVQVQLHYQLHYSRGQPEQH